MSDSTNISLDFNTICNLKHAQNPDNFKPPSLSWFRGWWKANDLHKIKAKPLAAVRMTAQNEKEITVTGLGPLADIMPRWNSRHDVT